MPEKISQEVEITDLAFGGDGVAHADDGRVLFVPFTAIGDTVTVEQESVHANFARVRVTQILKPGPGRTPPACPHFGRCGGCVYQHLDHETQIAAKRAQLEALLRRIGGIDTPPAPEPVVRSPHPYAYRNKLRVEPIRIRPEVTAGDPVPALAYGFCERDNQTFFDLDACPLADPALNDMLPRVQKTDWARRNARRAHPRPLTLRLAGDGRTYFYFGYAPKRISWLHEELCGRKIGVPLGAFWQVNPTVAEALFETAAAWFAASLTPLLIDVYAGVGPFAARLGRDADQVRFIEADPEAYRAARTNLRQWNVPSAEGRLGPAEKILPDMLRGLGPRAADATVLLDPPRAGCARAVTRALANSAVPQILYIACDPARLARDIRTLREEGGFTVTQLAFFDMFPQTAHFEAAAFLRR